MATTESSPPCSLRCLGWRGSRPHRRGGGQAGYQNQRHRPGSSRHRVLNGQKPDSTADAKRKSAERLIDQYVIRAEMEQGEYARARTADVEAMLAQIRKQRFGGSEVRLKQELARYGLSEDQLRMQLQWQMDVLKFIDERFKPGVLVTEEEVRSYYDEHLAEIRREYPQLKLLTRRSPRFGRRSKARA